MAVRGQNGNNLTEETKEAVPPKKKKKSKVLILLILLLVCLIGGGVIFATGWGQGLFGRPPQAADAAEEKPVYSFELPELVFNLADGGRRRFLSIKMSFAFAEPALTAELERRMPEIRDAILTLMWGVTMEEITEESSIERMKKEIRDAANNILQTGEITDVYFWHVMVQ